MLRSNHKVGSNPTIKVFVAVASGVEGNVVPIGVGRNLILRAVSMDGTEGFDAVVVMDEVSRELDGDVMNVRV